MWALTPREYVALRDIWSEGIERQQWAVAWIISNLWNMMADTEGVPFTAADALGKGDRKERLAEAYRKKWQAERILAKTRAALQDGSMEPPDWLLGTIADNKASKLVH